MSFSVTITDILSAAKFLSGRIRRTPFEYSPPLSSLTGGKVWLKLENQQIAGSFKPRGAFRKMFSLSADERARGVITCSSGNHAQAMAMAAAALKTRTVICVPGQCPQVKRDAICEKGGEFVELRVIGAYYDEAEAECLKMAGREGLTFVSAFDDPAVVAGQGTVGIEMAEDEPGLDVLVCPISGGGLIRGVATALETLCPGIKVYGVHAAANPAWAEALKRGRVEAVNEEDSVADALSGGACSNHFEFVRGKIGKLISVTEDEIERGIRFMFEKHRQLVEGGGAVGVAAVLSGKIDLRGRKVGIVVSGGNIGEETFLRVLERTRRPH